MLIPHGATIALVDGRTWTLFRNAGDEATPLLAPVPTVELVEHNHGSGGRHGMSAANPDGHQLAEDAHAAAVAQWFDREVKAHRIGRLIVIAPPRTLGELRFHFTRQVRDAILLELPKDFMGREPCEIIAALRAR